MGLDGRDAALRRILNHTAPRADVLHRHDVEPGVDDIVEPLRRMQEALGRTMDAAD